MVSFRLIYARRVNFRVALLQMYKPICLLPGKIEWVRGK